MDHWRGLPDKEEIMGWERFRTGLAYLIAILGTFMVAFVTYSILRFFTALTSPEAITNAIYAATAFIVALYTAETWGMRRQMVRQYELDVHPLVIVTTQNAQNLPHSIDFSGNALSPT
jgi:hypothetical protein